MTTARGLQKEYLEALSANIKARQEFEECCHRIRRVGVEPQDAGHERRLDPLKEHLEAIKLRQRRDKLEAIEGCLTSLTQKPAASPSFLDPEEVFRDSRPLPTMPKDLMVALGSESTTSRPPLKELIDQLERHVLQAKLLLTREEQLLEEVKARSTARPGSVSDGAKLEALNRTRVELIAWIEAELNKAGEGDQNGTSHPHATARQSQAEPMNMDEQLASIKEKYAQYIDARKTLLRLVSEQPHPVLQPPQSETTKPNPASPSPPPAPSAPAVSPPTPPITHLLTPYLDQLLTISRSQRGLIAHKSHLNTTITKQVRENLHLLDRLAEESQLLSTHDHPSSSSSAPTGTSHSRTKSGSSLSDLAGGGGPSASAAEGASSSSSGGGPGSGPSARVRPWVLAADSAKIATLETVAEKIEEGQMALESTMRTLGEVEELVVAGERPATAAGGETTTTPSRAPATPATPTAAGSAARRRVEGGEAEDGEEDEEDIWLPPSRRQSLIARRRHTVGKAEQLGQQQGRTVWDVLDGSLGLLRAEREN
ncbi:hypothetical protein VTJ04DRAFT_2927 [Mycothermus thermophilus]|uniref:uncharacterized protein n=1 Tax=Humicola insolens TaxID=85995 RepID=UPI0037429F42